MKHLAAALMATLAAILLKIHTQTAAAQTTTTAFTIAPTTTAPTATPFATVVPTTTRRRRPICKTTTHETESTEEPISCSLPPSFIKQHSTTVRILIPKEDCDYPYLVTPLLVPDDECTPPPEFIRRHSTTISTYKRTLCPPDEKFSYHYESPLPSGCVTLRWFTTSLSTTACTSPPGFVATIRTWRKTCASTATRCTSPREFEKYFKTPFYARKLGCLARQKSARITKKINAFQAAVY